MSAPTESGIETVGLLEGIATTRAIRRFRPEPIPESDLAKMFFAATRGPSGSNRQPFRFLVLRDGPHAREVKALLKQSAARAWGDKRAHEGYDEVVSNRPQTRKARVDAAMQHLIEHFEEVPVVAFPCLVRYRPPSPGEGGSVYPAAQNLLLAARALGYGGVITGYHHNVEPEVRRILGIPDHVFIAATIPMGKPIGRHGPVRRRPMQQLVYEDTWEGTAAWAIDPPGTQFVMGTAPPPPEGRLWGQPAS